MRRPATIGLGILLSSLCAAAVIAAAFAVSATPSEPPPFPSIPTSSDPRIDEDRPLYYPRAVTAEDLAGRTLRELSLMRNWIYARAGNPFRKSWLREFFDAQPWYEPQAAMDRSRLSALDLANAEAIARKEVSYQRRRLLRIRDAILELQDLPDEARIELELLNDRLGDWRASSKDDRPTPLQDPSLLEKQITLAQLADFSRRDLKLLRNTIYARRGRPFESELVRTYFEQFEWYAADSSYTDAKLRPIDRRNVKLIRSLEDEIGGPLSDEEERDWMSAA